MGPNGDDEVPAVGTTGLGAVGKTAGLTLKLPKVGIVPALGGTFAEVFFGVGSVFILPADQSKVALGFASEDDVSVAIVPGFSLLQIHFVLNKKQKVRSCHNVIWEKIAYTSSLFWSKQSGHFHPSDTGIFNPAADQSKPFFSDFGAKLSLGLAIAENEPNDGGAEEAVADAEVVVEPGFAVLQTVHSVLNINQSLFSSSN